ncbi:hypothetical protein JK386_01650 [Nocardioides sp. zg-536]|uniref:Integral membrane protein n=1 Tax=Nocardioides faecalis TaxID=2803858 RepID=A0A938Y7F0_9ACTN|nr:hypothetical protein [Nocardioides faecalis]MBM9458599.1 hypothetical protein [Nocardioides faecalis]MBS4752930.1 hypothetical protein [Nocardioides faecalis]QVI58598.1 hypothetical protein KG111_16740 [Nocardioides faecalis]
MRSFTAGALVLLATLVAPLVVATSWLDATIADRDEFVATMAPLADDREVRDLLAQATADAAVDNLQQHLPITLPDAVSEWALAGARGVTESPGFAEFWRRANEDLHKQILTLLEDPDASVEGSLTVDASPLLAQVLLGLEERGIPLLGLPEVQLSVPVGPRAEVADAGPKYRAAERVADLLPFVWAGLVALALVVVAGWRGMLRVAGCAALGVALAALLVPLAVDPVTDLVVDRADVRSQELARILLDALTGSVAPYARTYLIALPVGLLLLVVSLWPRRRRVPTIDGAPARSAA